tara:strand:- start:320 stop:958 length:639 start_codon:yes stop_codon:yes gene_type:complete
MKTVALILARGGSKGIPNKNIINLRDKPLISYSINAANQSNCDETWVSTDSNEIKKIAKSYGANVIDRPKELSGDYSKSEEALVHFSDNIDYDILIFIQPTSPLLNAQDINYGLESIKNNQYDSVFSVYKEHWIPRWTQKIVPVNWDIDERPMRQEKENQFVENGAFYITTKEQFSQSKRRYGGHIGVVEMPNYRSFQIDSMDDLKLIEKLL